MDAKTEALIEILAVGDRAFMPIRRWSQNYAANRYFAQKHFPFVAWRGGGSDVNRKRAQTLLDELVAAGSLERYRSKSKTTRVALTQAAEQQIRSLCGLPDLSMSLRAMYALSKHCGRGARVRGRWIDEIALNDGKGWDGTSDHNRSLGFIAEALLPVMRAGFVESGSTRWGHCRYRITTMGWARIKGLAGWEVKAFSPSEVGELPFSKEANDLYLHALEQESKRFFDTEPEETGEIGFIPLPVSD